MGHLALKAYPVLLFILSAFLVSNIGDVLILIIFGPNTVVFSYLTQSGQTEWATIYYAVPLALNTGAAY